MTKLRELRARIDSNVKVLKTLRDGPAGEGGALSAEQLSKAGEIRKAIDADELAIELEKQIEDYERRQGDGHRLTGGGDRQFDEACARFSILRAVGSQIPKLNIDGGLETEVSQELSRRAGISRPGIQVPMSIFHARRETRAVTTTLPATGPGGYAIGTELRPEMYFDRLREALVIGQSGATIISGLTQNIDVPGLAKSAPAQWIAEGADLTAADPDHKEVALRPRTVGTLTEWSILMLLQSTPSVEEMARADMAQTLAAGLDGAAINGTGGAQPTGILQTAGVASVSGAAGLSWGLVVDIAGRCDTANAAMARLAYLTNSHVRSIGRKTVKVAGGTCCDMVWGDDMGKLAGLPAWVTNLVPNNLGATTDKSALICGDFSQAILAYWDSFSLVTNPYGAAFKRGGVEVRALLTADFGIRNPAAFAACTDLA